MAKVIAPFKIQGSIEDLNFVVNADGTNYVRIKSKTGVTKEEFKNNPIFDRIRNQGKEMGYCVKKARTFRLLAKQFFDKAKEVSSAGRLNQLLLEILSEDTINPKGERTLEEGLKSMYLDEILLGFEANKLRPLQKVLLKKGNHTPEEGTLSWNNFSPESHIQWPLEEATHVKLQIANTHWDVTNDTFETYYSNQITLEKNTTKKNLLLTCEIPKENKLRITFLFIGFVTKQRSTYKDLHRKHNTTTLIAYQKT